MFNNTRRRLTIIGVGLQALVGVVALVAVSCHDKTLVLFAQTLPVTLHVAWTPSPAGDAVVSYKTTVDTNPAVVVPLTACTATVCTAAFTVTTYGAHAVVVRASNLSLSTDPTSLQDSLPTTVSFVLKPPPAAVGGATVTN